MVGGKAGGGLKVIQDLALRYEALRRRKSWRALAFSPGIAIASACVGLHGPAMAAAKFHVEVRGDVAVLVQEGSPLFDETTQSLAAVIKTATKIGSKKIIVDARLSDLANYYTYVVRHAELLSFMGFDNSFRSAIVGLPEQVYVMDFIVAVGQNRGWKVRRFYDIDEALQWLAE